MGRHLAIAAIYFGKYPSTFKYWMQSCGLNKDIDFYLISDYVKPDEMPENMFYAVSSIQDFENRVQKYLHIRCRLDGRIFKICDFRPLVHITCELKVFNKRITLPYGCMLSYSCQTKKDKNHTKELLHV